MPLTSAKRHPTFNLALKLWLILLACTTLLVVSLVIWFRISVDRGFQNFIERQARAHAEALKPQLEALYRADADWSPLADNPQIWRHLIREAWYQASREYQQKPGPANGFSPPPTWLRHLRQDKRRANKREQPNTRIVLVGPDYSVIMGSARILEHKPLWLPLLHRGRTIGYVGYATPKRLRNHRENNFLQQQSDNLIAIGLIGLAISGGFALLLAALLVRPIRRLQHSTQALISGDYHSRIQHVSNDELGALAHHFNQLAATLEDNQQSRRRWTMDIAHELRTPVTFIKGQIEALIDGVRPASGDNLAALQQHINQLSRLIDDLYQLSQSELGALSYRKQPLAIPPLIDLAASQASVALAEAGLDFKLVNHVPEQQQLLIDRQRFAQLLDNLLANSLRHTQTPGRVQLSAHIEADNLILQLADSAPGVSDGELPKLFEHLYRTDQSRNAATGGAGIGLALCRNIVQAHGGSIGASHSPLGGLTVTVRLPLQPLGGR